MRFLNYVMIWTGIVFLLVFLSIYQNWDRLTEHIALNAGSFLYGIFETTFPILIVVFGIILIISSLFK